MAGLAATSCSVGGNSFSLDTTDGSNDASASLAPTAATFRALPDELDSVSARFEILMDLSMDLFGEGIEMSAPFSGEFSDSLWAITFDFAQMQTSGFPDSEAGPPEIRFDYIVDSPNLFIRFDGDEIPLGDDWYHVDISEEFNGANDLFGFNATQTDPLGLLGVFTATDDVETLGRDSIRGVDATHYQVTVDLDEAWNDLTAAERAGFEEILGGVDPSATDVTLPYDVWLDDQNRLRRVTLATNSADFPAPETSDGADFAEAFNAAIEIEFSMTIDVFDYDDPSISVQVPDNAIELTDELSLELDGLFAN